LRSEGNRNIRENTVLKSFRLQVNYFYRMSDIAKDKEMLDRDLYGELGLTPDASEKDITKVSF